MNGSGSTEGSKIGNLWESTEEGVLEIRTLTQEVVNKQIKRFIAPTPHKTTREINSNGATVGYNTTFEPSPPDWLERQLWCSRLSAWLRLYCEIWCVCVRQFTLI